MHHRLWATIWGALATTLLVASAACTNPTVPAPRLPTPTVAETPIGPRRVTRTATQSQVTLAQVVASPTPTGTATATILSPTNQGTTPTPTLVGMATATALPPTNQDTTPAPGRSLALATGTPEAIGTGVSVRYCPSTVDDYEIQLKEWLAYVQEQNLPRSAIQVDLQRHAKVSQYLPEITAAYGFNACGLVAAAAAVRGQGWLPLAAQIRTSGGNAYAPESGIQPSPYAAALRQTLGGEAVIEENEWTLCELYSTLHKGALVIVDIQVGSQLNERPEWPTTESPDYAHFARVLGIDLDQETIYVENTLRGEASYWQLTLQAFWEVWKHPETAVSVRAPNPEDVTRWAVIIYPQKLEEAA